MSDNTGDMWLTLHVNHPESSHEKVSWVIDSFTDGPDGSFVMFDSEGRERLLIDPQELMELKNKENKEYDLGGGDE